MEENKKNNVILSILCLILAFACMVALLSVGEDKGVDVPSDTDKVQDTDSGDNGDNTDSGNTSVTKPAEFYLDGDLGYRVIGNQTVFFLVCENPSWYTSAYEMFKHTWYLDVNPTTCVSYEGLTIDIRYSKNKGVTWSPLTKTAEGNDDKEVFNIYSLYNIGASETVYLSYAFVSNCVDPVSVLSDLRENVFDDKVSNNHSGIDFSYTEEHYEDFPVYRYNYKYDDVIIPSG